MLEALEIPLLNSSNYCTDLRNKPQEFSGNWEWNHFVNRIPGLGSKLKHINKHNYYYGHCPQSCFFSNKSFRNCICFRHQVKKREGKVPTHLNPLEQTSADQCTLQEINQPTKRKVNYGLSARRRPCQVKPFFRKKRTAEIGEQTKTAHVLRRTAQLSWRSPNHCVYSINIKCHQREIKVTNLNKNCEKTHKKHKLGSLIGGVKFHHTALQHSNQNIYSVTVNCHRRQMRTENSQKNCDKKNLNLA